MIKTGYKIVFYHQSGEYSSVFTTLSRMVQYKKNRWVTPTIGHGPLAVFDNLPDARKFKHIYLYNMLIYRVHECLYEPSPEKFVWELGSNTVKLAELPPGTRLARRVKLLEEVK